MEFFERHVDEPGWVGVYALIGFVFLTALVLVSGVIQVGTQATYGTTAFDMSGTLGRHLYPYHHPHPLTPTSLHRARTQPYSST